MRPLSFAFTVVLSLTWEELRGVGLGYGIALRFSLACLQLLSCSPYFVFGYCTHSIQGLGSTRRNLEVDKWMDLTWTVFCLPTSFHNALRKLWVHPSTVEMIRFQWHPLSQLSLLWGPSPQYFGVSPCLTTCASSFGPMTWAIMLQNVSPLCYGGILTCARLGSLPGSHQSPDEPRGEREGTYAHET